MAEAIASHGMQEIRLVLAGVLALVQLRPVRALLDTRVVTGGKPVRAESPGMPQAIPEFDLAIAQHVRVGREPCTVGSQEIGKDLLAILLGQIHAMQRNVQLGGHPTGILEVFGGGAVALLVLLPVVHEQSLHLVARALQQQCGYRRVHAPGQRNDDARARAHLRRSLRPIGR